MVDHPSPSRSIMSLPDAQLDALIAAFPGEVGLVVRDLTDGRTYAHDPDGRFLTASVFKLPVMVELLRQVEAGRHSFGDRHVIHEGLCRHGTHSEESAVGTAWSLLDLCRRMIADSDDIATDLILEVIDVDAVNPTMEALGFVNTRVCMRMCEDVLSCCSVRVLGRGYLCARRCV